MRARWLKIKEYAAKTKQQDTARDKFISDHSEFKEKKLTALREAMSKVQILITSTQTQHAFLCWRDQVCSSAGNQLKVIANFKQQIAN
jgi:hypothetical protein